MVLPNCAVLDFVSATDIGKNFPTLDVKLAVYCIYLLRKNMLNV